MKFVQVMERAFLLCATVRLTGINGTGTATVSLGFLVGDVNSSRSVNASDIGSIKARIGQIANPGNAKFDLNASGTIDAADLPPVKARSGLVMP